jgi:lipopolysaccharide export system protein LptA
MNAILGKPFAVLTALALVLVLAGPVKSESLQKELEKSGSKPMVIKSKTLEVNDKSKLVTFTGSVKATRDDFVIDCDKMVVYYENRSDKRPGKGQTRIDKIVATGNVRIDRAKGGTARAAKAVYFQQSEKVVLTGNPVVKKGNDYVEGDRITIFLKENRSIVESSKDKRVKAVIHPNRIKR